jgi:ATP-binding cassette subfamily F protein 3
VQYAATIILQNINFEIRDTEKIAIVGRNGCGKSTLLKVIAGMVDLDDGYVNMAGKPNIGYLEQSSFKDTSISATVKVASLMKLRQNIRVYHKYCNYRSVTVAQSEDGRACRCSN